MSLSSVGLCLHLEIGKTIAWSRDLTWQCKKAAAVEDLAAVVDNGTAVQVGT
jgi:hypothetical protein